MPLTDGRITLVELDECAARAGLTLSAARIPPMQIRASMLPALLVDQTGDALIVLHRRGDEVEVAAAGSTARSGLRSTCCKRNIPVAGSSFVRSSASTRAACSTICQGPALVLGRLPGQSLDLRLALLATVLVNLFGAVIPFTPWRCMTG